MRYRLLDSVRAYAADRLAESGQTEVAAAAHASWYAETAAWCAANVQGARQPECVAIARAERSNVDAALSWCRTHDPALGVRIVNGFGWTWVVLGDGAAGASRVREALAPGTPARERATGLLLAGWLEASAGNVDLAQADIDAARAIAEDLVDDLLRADVDRHQAFLSIQQGHPADVLACATASLATYRQLSLQWQTAASLLLAAFGAIMVGDTTAATRDANAAIGILTPLGDSWGLVHAQAMLAAVAQSERRFDDAATALAGAAEQSRALGFQGQEALHLAGLARVQQRSGNTREAAESFDRAIAAAGAVGDGRLACTARLNLARLRRAEGDHVAAVSLLKENRRWYESAGGGDGALLNSCLLHAETDDTAPLQGVLEQARAEQNDEVGVLALDALARLAAQQGDVERARQLARRSRRTRPERRPRSRRQRPPRSDQDHRADARVSQDPRRLTWACHDLRVSQQPPDPAPALADWAAAALVFGSSAAVLVVELVALRLLAPYLGLTLETNTIVIGTALVAIALGARFGGRAADAMPPRRAIAPLLSISGVAVAATPFAVRGAGELGDGPLMLVAGLAIIIPGALLSAVTPMVTKLMLTSLAETGTVVGRLSGIATTGAIFGTVVTGFVLISRVPVTGIMVGLGLMLLVAAIVFEIGVRRRPPVLPVVLILLAAVGTLAAPWGCDAETRYHCAEVRNDPNRAGGRLLVLDGLSHSYVDLDEPTHLEFAYVKALAGVVDASFDPREPLDAYHLGGGGVTFPRYLAETRPGTRSLVSEIDPGVIDLDSERLGLDTGRALQVRIEDGRTGVRRVPDASRDLVVGDAFGGVSVPWHLTTVEAVKEVHRVLRPEGVYAANLIDYPPLGFARAELATLRRVFDHVALAAEPDTLSGEAGGNLVAIASDSPIDTSAVERGFERQRVGWGVIDGAQLTEWIDGAEVLTDDYAPVDQLLTPYPSA